MKGPLALDTGLTQSGPSFLEALHSCAQICREPHASHTHTQGDSKLEADIHMLTWTRHLAILTAQGTERKTLPGQEKGRYSQDKG